MEREVKEISLRSGSTTIIKDSTDSVGTLRRLLGLLRKDDEVECPVLFRDGATGMIRIEGGILFLSDPVEANEEKSHVLNKTST